MVYDCFPFFNELDILEIRLNVLKDVVDKFVLVEAGETHVGKPKPLYFEENKGRFSAFLDRIVYIKIERFPPGHDAWWNENYQRNELMKGLVNAHPEDDVILSDLDEIPNPDIISQYKGSDGVKVFCLKSYSFFLNFRDVRTPCISTTKMFPYKIAQSGFDGVDVYKNEFLPEDLNKGTTLTKIRRRTFPSSRGGELRIKNAGWHFTCMGGADAMAEKMKAVAPHHDFDANDSSLDSKHMAELIAKGKGPALKMNCFGEDLDGSFPSFVLENKVRYGHLIFDVTEEYRRRTRIARMIRTWQGHLIAFLQTLCPEVFHNWLHLKKMRVLTVCQSLRRGRDRGSSYTIMS